MRKRATRFQQREPASRFWEGKHPFQVFDANFELAMDPSLHSDEAQQRSRRSLASFLFHCRHWATPDDASWLRQLVQNQVELNGVAELRLKRIGRLVYEAAGLEACCLELSCSRDTASSRLISESQRAIASLGPRLSGVFCGVCLDAFAFPAGDVATTLQLAGDVRLGRQGSP